MSLPSYQDRVAPWMLVCFGEAIAADIVERNHRFLEEALELVQSTGCTASEAHQLVDYVFSRPVGETRQEIGGVMVTLAALCIASAHDMQQAGEEELNRIWTKVEAIRGKQAAKPKHSPLPQHVDADQARQRLRLEIINTPETADFIAAVPLEAAHQRERWDAAHDAGKDQPDWFWLIGYLAGKALRAAIEGDLEKAKHHTISAAAALANWHAALSGAHNGMRPGIGAQAVA